MILLKLDFQFWCIIAFERDKFLIYLFAGLLDGIIRGLVGFVKNKTLEKANHFKPQYFLVTVLISAIGGVAAGISADTESFIFVRLRRDRFY